MIVEEDAIEVVDLVLKHDGVVASGGDVGLFAQEVIVGFHDDLEVTVDVAGMLFVDA